MRDLKRCRQVPSPSWTVEHAGGTRWRVWNNKHDPHAVVYTCEYLGGRAKIVEAPSPPSRDAARAMRQAVAEHAERKQYNDVRRSMGLPEKPNEGDT